MRYSQVGNKVSTNYGFPFMDIYLSALESTKRDSMVQWSRQILLMQMGTVQIPGLAVKNGSWPLPSDMTFKWVYNMYHCTLWPSKRSIKASKCVGLLSVLRRFYNKRTSLPFILQTYSSKVIKEVLLINC